MGKIHRREAQYPTLSDQHLLARYTDILHPWDSINTCLLNFTRGKITSKGDMNLADFTHLADISVQIKRRD